MGKSMSKDEILKGLKELYSNKMFSAETRELLENAAYMLMKPEFQQKPKANSSHDDASGITAKQAELLRKMKGAIGYWDEIEALDSKAGACKFIGEHMDEYLEACKAAHNKAYYSKKYVKDNSSYYSDNPFAGPYDSDIVDCYDMGITPWGDS